ncbi:MAG: VOC family protein [Bacteroidota bacterium]
MTKGVWINLPVKNINRSREFYTSLGFSFNTRHGNTDHSAAMVVGEKEVIVMLFDEPAFKSFTGGEIADTAKVAEVLLSIDASGKEEVDEMAAKAVKAGGKSDHIPAPMKDWMYGCIFSDPDGHRWNVLFMDMEKMPGKS